MIGTDDQRSRSQTDRSAVDPRPLSDLPFGANLEPVLRKACGNRLSPVTWFRTDWQRGGALTGYATYRDDADLARAVVVKLPVGPGERQWLLRLQAASDVVPRVYADGQSLGGYDMAWVVMERLAYGPLSTAWQGQEFDLLTEVAARFYAAASEVPVGPAPADKDWQAIFDRSRESVRRHRLEDHQRWNRSLKKAHRKLKLWQRVWQERPVDQWCHGDLHLANAMTRVPPPGGPAVLLDFAMTHAGCWVEDAVYVEHLFWGRPQGLGGRKLCRQIARQRRKVGLPVAKDWSRYASVMRALLAMSTPAMLKHDGDPSHVKAALTVLETELNS